VSIKDGAVLRAVKDVRAQRDGGVKTPRTSAVATFPVIRFAVKIVFRIARNTDTRLGLVPFVLSVCIARAATRGWGTPALVDGEPGGTS
jgi:hypothetical protein